MNFCKRFLPFLIAVCILLNVSGVFAISISSKGGFVLNADTYEEVYSYNGDTALVPASMTKVMSAYVIYDAISQGLVSKETQISVSDALARYSRDPLYSNVYLSSSQTYSLDELLGAIFVVSANAAVMAVGDYIYGSEKAFVDKMNEFIKKWGIDAHFADCTGVSSSNRVTPRAMATIANRLTTDYPDCLNYSGLYSIDFRGQTYYATNKMLPGRTYSYDGTIGLKTGTTSAAGACFTGIVERDGVRLISVIMGAPYSNCRYTDSIKMLDYAFELKGVAPVEHNPNPRNLPVATLAKAVYVNDTQIPGFCCGDNNEIILVRVEDLANNGFDVIYNEDSNTITAINNSQKELGQNSFDNLDGLTLESNYPVNIMLKKNSEDLGIYTLTAYSIGDSPAVDVQELTYLGWVAQRDGTAVIVTR